MSRPLADKRAHSRSETTLENYGVKPPDVAMGTAKVLPTMATSYLSDDEGRVDHKRQVHNEVERRRKVKMNNWIYRLGDLLPRVGEKKKTEHHHRSDCSQKEAHHQKHSKISKNWILEQAVDYVKDLQVTNEKLMLGGCAEVQVTEFQKMKDRIQELEKRNSELTKLVENSGLPVDVNGLWQSREKYSHKLDPESVMALVSTTNDKPKLVAAVATTEEKVLKCLPPAPQPACVIKTKAMPPASCRENQVQLMSQNGVFLLKKNLASIKSKSEMRMEENATILPMVEQQQMQMGGSGGTFGAPTTVVVSQQEIAVVPVSGAAPLTSNGTAVTQALPGMPIMSTNQHTSGTQQQLLQHQQQHQQQQQQLAPQQTLPVLNYGNTVNIFPGVPGQGQPMIIINEQGVPLLHNMLPGQVFVNPVTGQPIACTSTGNFSDMNGCSAAAPPPSALLNSVVGSQAGTMTANHFLVNSASAGGQAGTPMTRTLPGQMIVNGPNVGSRTVMQTVPTSSVNTGLLNSTLGQQFLQSSMAAPGQVIITSTTAHAAGITRMVTTDAGGNGTVVMTAGGMRHQIPNQNTAVFNNDGSVQMLGPTSYLAPHQNTMQFISQAPQDGSGQVGNLPQALLLPNGQIIPVVSQPSLIYPGASPISGGLLMAPTPPAGSVQQHQPVFAAQGTVLKEAPKIQSRPNSRMGSGFVSLPVSCTSNSVSTATITTTAGMQPIMSDGSSSFGSSVVLAMGPAANECISAPAAAVETKKPAKRSHRAIKPKPAVTMSATNTRTTMASVSSAKNSKVTESLASKPIPTSVSTVPASSASQHRQQSSHPSIITRPAKQIATTVMTTDILAKATESIFATSVLETSPTVSNLYQNDSTDFSLSSSVVPRSSSDDTPPTTCHQPSAIQEKPVDSAGVTKFETSTSIGDSSEDMLVSSDSKEENNLPSTDILRDLVADVYDAEDRDMPLLQPISPVVETSTGLSQSLVNTGTDVNVGSSTDNNAVTLSDQEAPDLSIITPEADVKKMSPLVQKRSSPLDEPNVGNMNKKVRSQEAKTDDGGHSGMAVSGVSFLSVSQLASSSFSIDTALSNENSPLGSISPLLVSPTKSMSSDGFLGGTTTANHDFSGGCNGVGNGDEIVDPTPVVTTTSPDTVTKEAPVADTNTAATSFAMDVLSRSSSSSAYNITGTSSMNLNLNQGIYTLSTGGTTSSVTNCTSTKPLSGIIAESSMSNNAYTDTLHYSTGPLNSTSLHNSSSIGDTLVSNYLSENQSRMAAAVTTMSGMGVKHSAAGFQLSSSMMTPGNPILTFTSNGSNVNGPLQNIPSFHMPDLQVGGSENESSSGNNNMNTAAPPTNFNSGAMGNSIINTSGTLGQGIIEHMPILPNDVGSTNNVPSFSFGLFGQTGHHVQQQVPNVTNSHMPPMPQTFSHHPYGIPASHMSRRSHLTGRSIANTTTNDSHKTKTSMGRRSSTTDTMLSPHSLASHGAMPPPLAPPSQTLSHTPPQSDGQQQQQQQQQQMSPRPTPSPVFHAQRSPSGPTITNYSAESLIGQVNYTGGTTKQMPQQQPVSRASISYSAESLIQTHSDRRSHCSQASHQRHQHTPGIQAMTGQFQSNVAGAHHNTATTQSFAYFPLQGSNKSVSAQGNPLTHFQAGKNSCLVPPQQQSEVSFSFSLCQPNNNVTNVVNQVPSTAGSQPVTTYPNLFHYPQSQSTPMLQTATKQQPTSLQNAVGFTQQHTDCINASSNSQPCANGITFVTQPSAAALTFQDHFVHNNQRNDMPSIMPVVDKPPKHVKQDSKASKASKHVAQSKKKQPSYSVEEVNLSNSIFETNRSVTPYFTVPNLSPPRNEAPTYIPNPSNLFNTANRQLAANSTVPQNKAPVPPDLTSTAPPYNPLFTPRSQSGLNLNFQAPGFGMNHIHGNAAAAANQIGSHGNVPNFNLSNIFPDISAAASGADSLNISPMKFHPGNTILPEAQHHHQGAPPLYNRPVLHNGMSINSLLAHNPHGFDGRPPVPVAINNTMAPPTFHGHGHTASFGNVIPTLNFSMHEH